MSDSENTHNFDDNCCCGPWYESWCDPWNESWCDPWNESWCDPSCNQCCNTKDFKDDCF